MIDSYRKLAKYYDSLYDYKDYDKEADFICKIFKKYALYKPRYILDLGCGTGGHIVPLAKRGYRGYGIDLSEQMIRIAKQKAIKAKVRCVDFKVASMQNFTVKKKFDAAISMSSAFCFLNTFADFKESLDHIRSVLRSNGLLLFDFWNGVVVLNQFSPTRVKVVKKNNEELLRISETKLDYSKQQAIVDIDVRLIKNKSVLDAFKNRHVVRFYFLDEMRNYLEMNGFKVLCLCPFGELNRNVDTLKDWNITIVSRKS